MKMKELLKLFENQKDETIFYGLKYMRIEQSIIFPNQFSLDDDTTAMFVILSCPRQNLKQLKKYTFERYTRSLKIPIFQTALHVKFTTT